MKNETNHFAQLEEEVKEFFQSLGLDVEYSEANGVGHLISGGFYSLDSAALRRDFKAFMISSIAFRGKELVIMSNLYFSIR
jgi:4'-phosphopantetheinyl transferase EntD